MTQVSIRDATAADVPRLKEIFRAASWSNIADRPLLEEHPEFLEWSGAPAAQGRTRLAELAGHVVGFVSTVDDGDAVQLEDLFVDPDWMRHGVARALVEDVAKTARARGATRLVVDGNRHALESTSASGSSSNVRSPSRTAPRYACREPSEPLTS
jgi:GNAT superfamily N-acetyltransferase